MAIVYRHIRTDFNVPFYIGIGKSIQRAYDKRNRNELWREIISKTDYEVEILFYDIPVLAAADKEKEFIKLYGRTGDGTGTLCNKTAGGIGTLGVTQDILDKKRASMLGKNKGENHWMKRRKIPKELHPMFGKKHSDETRKKLSESHKGQIPSNTKKVIAIKNGVVVGKYDSLKLASEDLGISVQNISAFILSGGRTKSMKGFIFQAA